MPQKLTLTAFAALALALSCAGADWVLNPPDLEMVVISAKNEQGGHNIHPTSDGGCIVAACTSNSGGKGRSRDLGVYKFTADLKLDPRFGDNGIWAAGSSGVDQAIDAIEIIGADGKPDGYLVAGVAARADGDFADCGFHTAREDVRPGQGNDIVLVRLNTDGTPRAGFGRNGMRCYGGSGNDTLIYHPSNYSEPGNKLLQVKGGFLVAGISNSKDGDLADIEIKGHSRSYDLWIFKVDDRGEFVRDFGDRGSMRLGVRPTEKSKRPANEYPWSIKADPAGGGFIASGYHMGAGFPLDKKKDGKMISSPGNSAMDASVETGSGDVNDASMDGWLFRADDKGRLRADWAGNGIVFIGGTRQEKMYDHIATPDGGYIVCGRTSSNDLSFARDIGKVENFGAFMVKYDKNGALVPAFGNNGRGVCFIPECGDQLSRICNYGESDIVGVVAGTDEAEKMLKLPAGYKNQVVVVRFDKNGKPLRHWSLGKEGNDWVCGMDVDAKGRILVTGYNDKGRPPGAEKTGDENKKGVHPWRDLMVMRFTPNLEK